MTTLQIYESVKQIFPSLLEPQIIAEMNHAQDKFARKTQILRAVGVLKTMTSQASWTLPSGVVEIYEIELYDSDGKSLHKVDENIDWFVDGGELVFFDTSSDTKITTIPTSISTIWVRYSLLPTTLTVVATALTIDTQFTEAVLAGTLETLYARTPLPGADRLGNPIVKVDFQAVKYWGAKFQEIVIDAKKWINSIDSTERRSRNYQHSGLFSLPKEAKDANITEVNWT